MAPRRKTRGSTKKKGKGQHKSFSDVGQACNKAQTSVSEAIKQLMPSARPEHIHWETLGRQHSSGDGDGQKQPFRNVYQFYKEATKRFVAGVQSLVPTHVFDGLAVNGLMDAANYIADNGISVERSIMNDLKTAIRVRKRVAASMQGGGDEGHSHFIAVLSYCWTFLLPQMKDKGSSNKEKRTPTSEKQSDNVDNKETNADENRYASLFTKDDAEEDDVEAGMDDIPSSPTPRPVRPKTKTRRLTMEELMNWSDRENAHWFLFTMDDLMSQNAEQFEKLKDMWENIQERAELMQTWKSIGQEHKFSTVIVEQMMEASVASNMAIQFVAYLEGAFIADNPHMDTPYRLLAVLSFPDHVRLVTELVDKDSSPLSHKFGERDAVRFVGDCIEAGFRAKSDPMCRKDTIVDDFIFEWKLTDSSTKEQLSRIPGHFIAGCCIEAPMMHEETMNSALMARSASHGLTKHSWLRAFNHIGNSRSITQTLRLVQGLAATFEVFQGRMMAKSGIFGGKWRDKKKADATSTIYGEMDDLLMSDILPTLINSCHDGLFAKQDLPNQDEIFPLFVHLKKYMKNPHKPVSWTLVFAIHTILVSVFEVQGSNHVTELGNIAKGCFHKYLEQIVWTVKLAAQTKGRRPEAWAQNLRSLCYLELLVKPVIKITPAQENRSFWNPFCAGSFLAYLAYWANLEAGTYMVDAVAQLRLVLHLYNAFLQVDAFEKSERHEALDWLYNTFRSSKGVWEGKDPPKQGEMTMRWFIAFGYQLSEARKMTDSARQALVSDASKVDINTTSSLIHNRYVGARKLTPIQPETLSKSFRRICHRDFSDVADNYHTDEQRERLKHDDMYHHAVRMNDTLDAIEDDRRLLSTNLVSLGEMLFQLFDSLQRIVGWEAKIQQMIDSTPDEIKLGRRVDGSSVNPSSFQASDENLRLMAIHHLCAVRILCQLDFNPDSLGVEEVALAATWLNTFFERMDSDKITWFVVRPPDEDFD